MTIAFYVTENSLERQVISRFQNKVEKGQILIFMKNCQNCPQNEAHDIKFPKSTFEASKGHSGSKISLKLQILIVIALQKPGRPHYLRGFF